MKIQRSQGFVVSLQGTSIMRAITILLVSVMVTFFLIGLLTSLKPEYRITSSSINEWSRQLSGASLIHLFGFENSYYTQDIDEDVTFPKLSTLAFEMTTSINPNDPRSLLGREIPGFSNYDGRILVAGEGANYTNMPYESSPPIEVLLQRREASIEQLKKLENESQQGKDPIMTTNGKKVAYIYASHSQESYLPLLENVTDPDQAYHDKANMLLVAKKLAEQLEGRGIGALASTEDFTKSLLDQNMKYYQSYDIARPAVKKVLAENKDITYLIDLHRDSSKKDTTVTINGKRYARIAFVVGGENNNYEKNEKIATELHNLLEKEYPGLSRGVIMKKGEGTDGKFNQDLSERALLVEIGGVSNDLDEVQRATDAFSDVFSELYWQAEKVNN